MFVCFINKQQILSENTARKIKLVFYLNTEK